MNADTFKIPKKPLVVHASDYGIKRLVAVGDIHGCIEELAELIKKVDLQDSDLLVFVGDLVDRGPAGPEVVDAVKDLCINRPATYCCLGNHEEKHVRYRHHLWRQKDNPLYRHPMRMKSHALQDHVLLDDLDVAWLAGLPGVVQLDVAFNGTTSFRAITHAGLLPNLGIHQETKALIRNRYLKYRIHEILGRKVWYPVHMEANFSQPPGSVNWDEAWTPEDTHGFSQSWRVIYGHSVHDLKTPRVLNNCYGIDTGCVFGGHLTAYVEDLSTGMVSFEQVQAKKTYFETKEP